jgi:hypothetical protein
LPCGKTGREHLITLLDALENAPRDGLPPAVATAKGLPLAVEIDALLRRSGLSWQELLPRHPTLAKICGRFGSAYPAEHHAAYLHAIRELGRRQESWWTAARLPEVLVLLPEVDAMSESSPIIEARPPDGDWITTIRGLLLRSAWRSPAERDLLHDLERQVLQGAGISIAHGVVLRDIWWESEVAGTCDAASQLAAEGPQD